MTQWAISASAPFLAEMAAIPLVLEGSTKVCAFRRPREARAPSIIVPSNHGVLTEQRIDTASED